MKKFLLATTAVVGAALFSQAALAQINVTTGGYLEFTAGFFDDDVANSSDRDFQTEAEVFVRADGKADNGLEYGAQIQFQNDDSGSNGMTVDEAFLTLAGSWGKVELGDTDGALDVLAVYAPVVEGYGQIDTDRDGGANYSDYLGGGPISVHAVDNDDSTKISYYTPNFSGFQAGVSYTPEFDEGQNVVTTDTGAFTGTQADYQDWFEIAASYTHDFGNWGVKVGLGIITADSKEAAGGGDVAEDFTAWNLGAQVSFAGFTFGAAYVDNDEFGAANGATGNDDSDGWNVGLTYETGPLAVGVSWLTSDDGVVVEDYDAYGVGMVYTVAPGLVVQSDLMFVDEELAGGGDNDGFVFMLGTRMTF